MDNLLTIQPPEAIIRIQNPKVCQQTQRYINFIPFIQFPDSFSELHNSDWVGQTETENNY